MGTASVGLSSTLSPTSVLRSMLIDCSHVVLGISHGGCYGALGLSRRQDLMFKPLVHKVRIHHIHPYLSIKHTQGTY